MRKIIPAFMILAATSANAVEVKFGDLGYNMKKGEQNFEFDFGSSYSRSQVGNTKSTMRAHVLKSDYRYAINDDFEAIVGLEYIWNGDVADGADKNNINSFKNPALGFSYRVFDQKNFAYNFDVEAITKQNFIKAKRGGSSANMFEGRSTYELHGIFSKKWNEANEWEAGFGMIYHADGDMKENNIKVDQESSTDLVFKVGYQYRPVNEFMINVSAKATYVGEYKSDKDFKEEGHLDYNFGFVAKYLMSENFIGRFNYNQSRLANFKAKTSTGNTDINSNRFNEYSFGIDYLF